MNEPTSLYSLLQFSKVLGTEQKTFLNLRASRRPDDQMKISWIERECDARGQVVFQFERLLSHLLATGNYQTAYDVSVRKEQVDRYGERFKGKALCCPFSQPKCRGNECKRCLDRRNFFAQNYRLPSEGVGS